MGIKISELNVGEIFGYRMPMDKHETIFMLMSKTEFGCGAITWVGKNSNNQNISRKAYFSNTCYVAVNYTL